MKEFLKQIEIALIDMWNDLYKFLCHLAGEEPKDNYIVNPYAD